MPITAELGSEIAACCIAPLLAEAYHPAGSWRRSAVNVAMGIAGGAYGPQGVELYLEKLKRAHLLVTFLCGFLGATILGKLLEYSATWKPSDIVAAIARAVDAFRKKPPGGS